MPTLAEHVFGYILDDTESHRNIVKDMSPDRRAAVLGRKGRLIVTGEEGGSFIVRITPMGFFREENGSDIRNEILMSDETLMEIMVWLAEDPNDPGMDPRTAYANRLIMISGDRVLYDAEEIFGSLEKYAFNRMKPIARAALSSMRRGKRAR